MITSLFVKNESFIIKMQILETIRTWPKSSLLYTSDNLQYKVFTEKEMELVANFYSNNGRHDLNVDYLRKEYGFGAAFHGIVEEGKIVAGMIIHSDYIYVDAPSFIAFQECRNQGIVLNKDTVYSSHNLVDPEYRGQHLYSILLYKVLEYYKDSKRYYLLMTGIDNYRMLTSSFDHFGKVIRIVKSSVVLRMINKREVRYENSKEICWSCVDRR